MEPECRDAALDSQPLVSRVSTVQDVRGAQQVRVNSIIGANSRYYHSPLTEDLNRVPPNSLPSSANNSVALFGSGYVHRDVAMPLSAVSQDLMDRSHNLADAANRKAPRGRAASTLSISSAYPQFSAKAANSFYAPFRLESQLLASPWSGYIWPAAQKTPTLHVGATQPNAYPVISHVNRNVTAGVYAPGSATTCTSGYRIISPSTKSLRQRQPTNNEAASPMQRSFLNVGRDNSFMASSLFASPGGAGAAHSAILDAPLQLSLVPPPPLGNEDRLASSFINSVVQFAPLTPALPAILSRRHSIYRDAMVDLKHFKNLLRDPPAVTLLEGTHIKENGEASTAVTASPDGSGSREGGTSFESKNTTTPLRVRPVNLLNSAIAAANEDASTASLELEQGTGQADWRLLEHPSRPLLHLHGAPSNALTSMGRDPDGVGEAETVDLDREEVRFACSTTPEVLASTRCDLNSALNMEADEMPPSCLSETRKLPACDSAVDVVGADGTGPLRTPSSVPIVLGTTPDLFVTADRAVVSVNDAAGEIATPLLGLPPVRSRVQPATPSDLAAPHPENSCASDVQLFMPVPFDQGAPMGAAFREITMHSSPSERSVSRLSLVPPLGLWQASPTALSALQPISIPPSVASNTLSCLLDIAETLRFLRSDIDNVDGKVSLGEHLIRCLVSGTLSLLLQLLAEMTQSVTLAMTESSGCYESTAKDVEPSDAFAELQDDMVAALTSCAETIRTTLSVIQRDQEALEPLLFTCMLARDTTASLLRLLGGTSPTMPTLGSPTTAGANSAFVGSRHRPTHHHQTEGLSSHVPLTEENIATLMDAAALRDEVDRQWPSFAASYNSQLLRYACLKSLQAAMCEQDDSVGGEAPQLEKLVAAWVSVQAESPVVRQPIIATGQPTPSTLHPEDNNNEVERAVSACFCRVFPPFNVVVDVWATFPEADAWRWWYRLLGDTMSFHFEGQRSQSLLAYAEKCIRSSRDDDASVALRAAVKQCQLSSKEVEEEIRKVEKQLVTMEEDGRSQRIIILQHIQRYVFVHAMVTSIHRMFGKDAPLPRAQLVAHVQWQRKSLEEVEAKIRAHHASFSAHIRHLRTFSFFLNTVAPTPHKPFEPSLHSVPKSGTCETPTLANHSVCNTASSASQDSEQDEMALPWNSPTVASLTTLVARRSPNGGSMSRQDDAITAEMRQGMGAGEGTTQSVVAAFRDAAKTIVSTVQSLCRLLQSEEDAAFAVLHRPGQASSVGRVRPSTRALRRLRDSLSDVNQSARASIASLHVTGS